MLFLPPDQLADVISFLISLILATIAFFLVGRLLSGVNAKFTDAFFVALLGLLLKLGIDIAINSVLVPGLNEIVVFAWSVVGLFATFIVWMILVQHFFDTLFFRGLIIVIMASILIFVIDFGINFIFSIIFP
ncbi:MAG: hypothetical protein ACFFD8_04765 [Candidatus Thorarchaeota archaeon]